MSYIRGPLTELEYTPVLFERIASLEVEVELEHEAACALALAVGDIGEILGVQVAIAECAETKQAARRIVAEVARLREALNRVEWTAPPFPAVCMPFCPWCGTTEEEGHRFDCMRQAALEPQTE